MSDYYDLDAILADGEKIPCRFNMSVPGLGYLEGNPGKPVEKDTKVELPLWLAEVLAVCELSEASQTSFIDLANPDFISQKVLNAIKANPLTVDLHSILTNYYKLSEKWAAMFNDAELAQVISTMLKERAFEINNYACNANKSTNNNFLYSLDEFEKALYKKTATSNKQMRQWIKN
ncbi:DNA replication complex GINS protein Psf3p [[Candida] anglica]|uniref:DNA replication complex GINS protein PSF3 n=1 Tax=[Candida] anglica TaxID=148631 RepID=A0ABP0EC78_9ASCO